MNFAAGDFIKNTLSMVAGIANRQCLSHGFRKLFTRPGDTVMDPFMGSGATNIVAARMQRNSIGMEVLPEYYDRIKTRLPPAELFLFESRAGYECCPCA